MPCWKVASLFVFLGVLLHAENAPRPEHPQPQFMRQQWMSLNGRWDFAFDDDNKGLQENYHSSTEEAPLSITVPYCFESKLSGIGDTSFHPVFWYRRYFEIPGNWQGKNILLHFGAVDYRAKVWLNGQLLGEHEGGNVPFSFNITHGLRSGKNMLTLRVEDPPTDRYIPRGKQYWEPKSKGIFYTRTSGIWQPVWLEATGENYLDFLHFSPDQKGTAPFEGELVASSSPLTLVAEVLEGGNVISRVETQTQGTRVAGEIKVQNPKLWSPDTPNLYDVRLQLRRGTEVLDEVYSYIGFRSVSVANGRVQINGKPTYLKLILDQGYWPESILTPPSDDAIKKDIEFTKAMGFNGVRKHQKLEDPRYLYWADKMGLLVSSEMANAYEFSEVAVSAFTKEWIAAMKRDFNHPSIIMWVPINESWGVPNLKDKRQQAYLKELYFLTHSLDASRLVIDNDGWEHTDKTDLFAIHDYAKTGDILYAKYKDVSVASPSVPKNAKETVAPGFKYNGKPLYLSEFGGIAFIPAGTNVPKESWGYSGVEKTREDAYNRLQGIYTALAKLPNILGICYTQLTDVEQEVNGLLTYERKEKFDAAKIKKLNDMLR